jgi:UDP-N-acetylmuramoyl-tripeptide--D-alanyl-D-alanine ligase
MMTLQQAMQWIPGARLHGDGSTLLRRVHTDSRTLKSQDLFVAIRGERFDANLFVAQARDAGASAALACPGALPDGFPGIEVDDTRAALAALAAGWRRQFNLPLVAVTGSNGKTTVTQMTASILRAWHGDDALATQGNFNNDIGLPLTLLRLRPHHRVAVVELGMNHPGEIAFLSGLASPTVALVNNAQREHLEFMETVEAVARENGAVFTALAPQGVAVFPEGDTYTPLWTALAATHSRLTFGEADSADVAMRQAIWSGDHWQLRVRTPAGDIACDLRIAGTHNVRNALAATACSLAAGAPLEAISRGLQAFEPVKGRSRAFGLQVNGRLLTVVDDTYNANPDSVRAAIEVLAALPGPHLLVLGDMGEVGDQGPQFHAEVGDHARACGIERLYTLGEQARAMGGRHFLDIEALNEAVCAELAAVSSVLVKGSRFMRMERVIEVITACGQTRQENAHAA